MKSIGTVIYSKKEECLQMIISYYPIENKSGKRYDYLTCLYPLGFGETLPVYFLDEGDYEYVIHEGLETASSEKFTSALKQHILELEEKNDKSSEKIDLTQFMEL